MKGIWLPSNATEDEIVKAILECVTPCCVIVRGSEDGAVEAARARAIHKAAIRARKQTNRIVSEEPGWIFVL